MLLLRTDSIVKFIVEQYINKAVPVASQRIANECEFAISPATIRNEMALLEEEGYITRPHPSAGAVPTDKGYRYYVDSLSEINLPLAEQRLVSHLFHQVEKQLDEWLGLAAALVAQLARNVAVVTLPKSVDCQFKHLELVSIQEPLTLLILVLRGTKIRQQLIAIDQAATQPELTSTANKLNSVYAGLACSQILAKEKKPSPIEQQITNCVIEIMQAEDQREYEEPYLDGWHFMLSQPEFARSQRMLALMELVEHRNLLRLIVPPELVPHRVKVIIGKENKAQVFHDYSVVISRYGLPNEAIGTVGILGPTRMSYARAISTVAYLSSVLSELAAELYEESPFQLKEGTTNGTAKFKRKFSGTSRTGTN